MGFHPHDCQQVDEDQKDQATCEMNAPTEAVLRRAQGTHCRSPTTPGMQGCNPRIDTGFRSCSSSIERPMAAHATLRWMKHEVSRLSQETR
jgi:hypothetical protein